MFITPLQLKYLSKNRWELNDDFEVALSQSVRIVVGAGFVTDLTSVPRIPGLYAWLKARAVRSAVVHDWLWRINYPRPEADRVFRRMVYKETNSNLAAVAMYLGVRLGSLFRISKPCPVAESIGGGVYIWNRNSRSWIREW